MTTCLVITSYSSAFDNYSYYRDCLNGFLNHPDLEVSVLDIQNLRNMLRGLILKNRYDAIIFSHSTFNTFLWRDRLSALHKILWRIQGKRAFFLTNEFRNIKAKCDMANYLGATMLISQLTHDAAQTVYSGLWDKQILSVPYGVDITDFHPQVPLKERPITIGFRGDYYPAYVGHDDRDLLLDDFKNRIEDKAINIDIKVGERFDRHRWMQFLNQCQILIGHEAGATRVDTDDNIRHFITSQQERLTKDRFRQLILALRQIGVFAPPPSGRIAAPRNFEAMATKTAQILLPGRYSDVLTKDVHYIELKRDFSNLDEVLEKAQDTTYLQNMVDHAYNDVVQNHTYQHRINTVLDKLL